MDIDSRPAAADRDPDVVSNLLPPTGITLAVGEENTATFAATYVLQQPDADRGYYDNTADVYGTAPDNTVVEDESDAEGGDFFMYGLGNCIRGFVGVTVGDWARPMTADTSESEDASTMGLSTSGMDRTEEASAGG